MHEGASARGKTCVVVTGGRPAASERRRRWRLKLPPVNFIIFYYIASKPVEILAVRGPSGAPAGECTLPGCGWDPRVGGLDSVILVQEGRSPEL